MIQIIKINKDYGIVCFPGETFEDFYAINTRLSAEGFGQDKRTSYSDFGAIRKYYSFNRFRFRQLLETSNLKWACASSLDAIWHWHGDGPLCINRYSHEIGNFEHGVYDSFGDHNGFLVRL
ncbi:TPA: hypothetical protein DD449_04185 [Candidatus Berkelbacteria bacterium]|uniref:Uncharacterized protein n=1 Tax=Berkelbacteria bacterium GW2011_GWE1_39_12 TaxID=1618337 RepID=A0A0G4B4E1_9BACT|nr:MAG: hypothetical protein UT28_C0001G0458 [Berkelbacteria bacterium GW2011_GWE1_39_12]HBO60854.1 hypothetical protein [Candidatus Berkelbacteria bacterium]